MKIVGMVLACLWLTLFPAYAMADTPAYRMRADQLLARLARPGGEADYFSTLFLNAVPVDRWRATAATLRASHGRPVAIGAVRQESETSGQVEVRYERATVGFTLVVARQAPHRVVGLHIVGTKAIGDDMDKVVAEIAALPGRTGFVIAELGADQPAWRTMIHGDDRLATGSSFKLYILAELTRAVAAGERRWSDVVPLGPSSFSGRLKDWPASAPMTLHSLATAMIAESDNSAADTLLLALDRAKVDAMVGRTGHADPDRTLPLLTTAEAFALKMPQQADLARRYAAASPDERRAILRGQASALTAASIDVGSVAETPSAIDSIEWFASPRDLVMLMDWLRRHGGDALPIMAINPGIAPADAKRWRYLGYKGGSEPGVMAMTFLAQGRDGQWFAIAGAWNNPVARIDEARFVALMTRALNLIAPAPR